MELPTFKNAELERSFDASDETMENCRNLFHKLTNERYQLLQRTGTFNTPLRAQPHFIGPQSTLLYQSSPPTIAEPPTVSTNWALWRTFPQTPDDSDRATLYLPFHRLDNLTRKRLGQADYLEACQQLVLEVQHAQRYDKYYAWFHAEASDKSASKTVALLNQEAVSAKDLAAAVCGPEYLDEFHVILHSLDSTCIQQLIDSFSQAVTADAYASYLRLMDSIRDERAICKVGASRCIASLLVLTDLSSSTFSWRSASSPTWTLSLAPWWRGRTTSSCIDWPRQSRTSARYRRRYIPSTPRPFCTLETWASLSLHVLHCRR